MRHFAMEITFFWLVGMIMCKNRLSKDVHSFGITIFNGINAYNRIKFPHKGAAFDDFESGRVTALNILNENLICAKTVVH